VKPRGNKNRRTVTARSVSGASSQATDVILNPRATKDEKIAAVGRVGEVAAQETVKKTVTKVATNPKVQRIWAQILEKAKAGPGLIGLFANAVSLVLAADPYARIRTLEELNRTEKALKRKLTPDERTTLTKQYLAWFKVHRETPIGAK